MAKLSRMQKRAKMMLLLLVGIISQTANAEIISSHNEQHTAQQTAQNYLLDKDCARTQITRTERFRLDSQNDSVKILGQEFIVTCIEKKQVAIDPSKNFNLSWITPTQREDGSILSPTDIRGYQVIINGSVAAMVTGNNFTTEKIIPPVKFSVRTVDNGGLISVDSNIVQVN